MRARSDTVTFEVSGKDHATLVREASRILSSLEAPFEWDFSLSISPSMIRFGSSTEVELWQADVFAKALA